jgi:hypothetical protein
MLIWNECEIDQMRKWPQFPSSNQSWNIFCLKFWPNLPAVLCLSFSVFFHPALILFILIHLPWPQLCCHFERIKEHGTNWGKDKLVNAHLGQNGLWASCGPKHYNTVQRRVIIVPKHSHCPIKST